LSASLALWLNDIAVSWGALGIDRVVVQSIEQIAYGKLRTQRAYSNQRGFRFTFARWMDAG
jgi:lipopolysaccharide export system permease protein